MSAMVASKPVSTATPMPRSRRKTTVNSAPATGDSVRSYVERMQVTKVVRASSAKRSASPVVSAPARFARSWKASRLFIPISAFSSLREPGDHGARSPH